MTTNNITYIHNLAYKLLFNPILHFMIVDNWSTSYFLELLIQYLILEYIILGDKIIKLSHS